MHNKHLEDHYTSGQNAHWQGKTSQALASIGTCYVAASPGEAGAVEGLVCIDKCIENGGGQIIC